MASIVKACSPFAVAWIPIGQNLPMRRREGRAGGSSLGDAIAALALARPAKAIVQAIEPDPANRAPSAEKLGRHDIEMSPQDPLIVRPSLAKAIVREADAGPADPDIPPGRSHRWPAFDAARSRDGGTELWLTTSSLAATATGAGARLTIRW